MSNIKISFSKQIATIKEMKLTLEQMGILEESIREMAVCTPDDKLEPIKDMVEKFGFDLSEIFYSHEITVTDWSKPDENITVDNSVATYQGTNGKVGN